MECGETLASIAKRYATTEAKIVELNTDATRFVYVGMELVIPIIASQGATKMTVSRNGDSVDNRILSLGQASSSTTNNINVLNWMQASYMYGFGEESAKCKSAYDFHFTAQHIVQNKYGVGVTFGVT